MDIDIQEKNSNIFINRIRIVGLNVSLFTGAVVSVDLFSNEKFIRNEHVQLSYEEYNQWLTDDWLVSYILQKLGFEKKVEPVESQPTEPPVEQPPVEQPPVEQPSVEQPPAEQQ